MWKIRVSRNFLDSIRNHVSAWSRHLEAKYLKALLSWAIFWNSSHSLRGRISSGATVLWWWPESRLLHFRQFLIMQFLDFFRLPDSCIQTWFTPCWSVLDFWKIKLKKSSLTNWIFSLQKSISKLLFAGYTGSNNPVRNRLKIQFVELGFFQIDFSEIKYRSYLV